MKKNNVKYENNIVLHAEATNVSVINTPILPPDLDAIPGDIEDFIFFSEEEYVSER